MRSIILAGASRVLFPLLLAFSLWLLWRGHNEPGGGFIGGLVACGAFALLAMNGGASAVRRTLRVDPKALAVLGLAVALLAGVLGPLAGRAFLHGEWATVLGQKLGSPLLFDVGVYLVVVGAVLTLLLALEEGGSDT